MYDTKNKSSLKNSLDNIMEIACQTITLSSVDSEYMTFRAVIRPPRKMLYSLEEIVDYFDKQRNNVISEYNIGKSKNDKLPLESPFKNKNGTHQRSIVNG